MEQETQIIEALRKSNIYTYIGRFIHYNLDEGFPVQELIDYLKDSYKDNQFSTLLALAEGAEFLKKFIS